jgi:hypothetical protein
MNTFIIDIQWLNTKARQLASVTDKPAHFGAGTIVADHWQRNDL